MTQSAVDVPALVSEFREVLTLLARRMRQELSFPLTQASTLGHLDREGPQTTSALAKAELIRHQSMAQTLGDLRTAGLVARRPDPDDGRQILYELTAKGRSAMKAERRSRDSWLARAMAEALDADEQARLADVLDLLRRVGAA